MVDKVKIKQILEVSVIHSFKGELRKIMGAKKEPSTPGDQAFIDEEGDSDVAKC